jgi:hypothetical protein
MHALQPSHMCAVPDHQRWQRTTSTCPGICHVAAVSTHDRVGYDALAESSTDVRAAAHLLPGLRHRGPLLRGRRGGAGGVQLPLTIRRARGRVLRLACSRRLQPCDLAALNKSRTQLLWRLMLVCEVQSTAASSTTKCTASCVQHSQREQCSPAYSMLKGHRIRGHPPLGGGAALLQRQVLLLVQRAELRLLRRLCLPQLRVPGLESSLGYQRASSQSTICVCTWPALHC